MHADLEYALPLPIKVTGFSESNRLVIYQTCGV